MTFPLKGEVFLCIIRNTISVVFPTLTSIFTVPILTWRWKRRSEWSSDSAQSYDACPTGIRYSVHFSYGTRYGHDRIICRYRGTRLSCLSRWYLFYKTETTQFVIKVLRYINTCGTTSEIHPQKVPHKLLIFRFWLICAQGKTRENFQCKKWPIFF